VRTEFDSATENSALKEELVRRIQSGGPITFREFMDAALYHPEHGYYRARREKIGRDGDYLTSPAVSGAFGVLVGRQVREMWTVMGAPARFDIVEAGAGTGQLALDILRWARDHAYDFWRRIRYTLVETSEALVERQRETFSGQPGNVEWRESLPARVEGCILSNELLDAFPVHRVAVRHGELLEVYVGWDGSQFVEELGPPSRIELTEYFERLGLRPGEGCQAEIYLEAPAWVSAAGHALRRGFLLTFDYGYDATNLYAPWRKDGTLLCFYRHNPSDDPYARLGRQDITSHIDLTTVQQAAEDAGLTTVGVAPQSEFLRRLGLSEAIPRPGEGEASLEEYYARRRAVQEIADPAGLGRIRVLIHKRGVPGARLTGLGDGNE
jgi:SAM-dependent MidA family methyltransferase